LARWGVVFRDLVAREINLPPWRELLWALRRMEAQGEIRGGRFVSGYVGEQFALPEALDALRAVRRSAPGGEETVLSPSDPLNLIGVILPGSRSAAQAAGRIRLVDGVPDALVPADVRWLPRAGVAVP
jgi:ATP-dependent Lhr-like helicase